MTPRRRKQLGAWYTPPALVDAVVARGRVPGRHVGARPRVRRRPLPARDRVCREQVGVDIDPATPFVHDDALARDWGDATVRRRGGQPAVPEPTVVTHVARRTVPIRWRSVCRCGRRVPRARDAADPSRRSRGAGAAPVVALHARCRSHPSGGRRRGRAAMDVVEHHQPVRRQRASVGRRLGGGRGTGVGAPLVRPRLRCRCRRSRCPARGPGLLTGGTRQCARRPGARRHRHLHVRLPRPVLRPGGRRGRRRRRASAGDQRPHRPGRVPMGRQAGAVRQAAVRRRPGSRSTGCRRRCSGGHSSASCPRS